MLKMRHFDLTRSFKLQNARSHSEICFARYFVAKENGWITIIWLHVILCERYYTKTGQLLQATVKC